MSPSVTCPLSVCERRWSQWCSILPTCTDFHTKNVKFPRSSLKVEVFFLYSIPSTIQYPSKCTRFLKASPELQLQTLTSATLVYNLLTWQAYQDLLKYRMTQQIRHSWRYKPYQNSTANYHETHKDANWLITAFNWWDSEEWFQLSVMKDSGVIYLDKASLISKWAVRRILHCLLMLIRYFIHQSIQTPRLI